MKIVDEVGNRYGRLEVVSYVGLSASNNAVWLCKCDCGNYTKVKGKYLRNGDTKSCGCLYIENLRDISGSKEMKLHGFSQCNDNCYQLWRSMKKRCKNHDNANRCYEGISVCEEWLNDFPAFREWAFEHGYKDCREMPYKTRLSIDRIDSSKGYSPDNCRFITVSENSTKANIERRHDNTEVTYKIAQGL